MGMTNAGALYIAAALIADVSVTLFNNANAYIGVGDGTTVFAATQTDLVGTNTLRKAMSATYPSRTGAAISFRSLFGLTEGNWAGGWQEWGVFNGSGAGTAGPTGVIMLNRKVENLGVKTSSEQWQITATITPTAA